VEQWSSDPQRIPLAADSFRLAVDALLEEVRFADSGLAAKYLKQYRELFGFD
jgi:hypothetical protein